MARRRNYRVDLGPQSYYEFLRTQEVLSRLTPVLRDIEDRRTYHPEGRDRAALSIGYRSAARRVVKSSAKARLRNDISFLVGYAAPDFVVHCIRRKQRKEVLHAKRLTRKGAGSSIRRRNWLSDIICT